MKLDELEQSAEPKDGEEEDELDELRSNLSNALDLLETGEILWRSLMKREITVEVLDADRKRIENYVRDLREFLSDWDLGEL